MALLLNIGDTVQRSYSYTKPSPSHISTPEECGNLVESGEHAGQYAIPISCGGTTQTIYLPEPLRKIGDYADTISSDGTVTRRVKKLVLTGEENYSPRSGKVHTFGFTITPSANADCISSHFIEIGSSQFDVANGIYARQTNYAYISDLDCSSATELKTFLAAQYAAGTPVTVWYVLATAQTEAVTVPTITPTKGANTLTVDTTLQPSEVSITGHIKAS